MSAGLLSTTGTRSVVAFGAVLASAGCIFASFLTWFTLTDSGGTTSVSGWGAVSGGQIPGENINDALNGNATFRPGLLAVVLGSLALLAALTMTVVSTGSSPMRIPASMLGVCGVGGLIWGIVRGAAPDSLGLETAGQSGGAGVGPWLLVGCSGILLAVAVATFCGLLDPQPGMRAGTLRRPPVRRRRIQPR